MREDERIGAAIASSGKIVALPHAGAPHGQDHLTWAYQTHVTAIYQYIYGRVGNRADGEDLTQAPTPRENPEAIQRVDSLLATLPESYRRVLELRFLRGYSVRETAQELNLSETNVKVLQFRALNRAGRERGRLP